MKIELQATMWLTDEEDIKANGGNPGKDITISLETTVIEDTQVMAPEIRLIISGVEMDIDLDELYHSAVTFKALKGE